MKNFDAFTLNQIITTHNACKERFPTVAALLEAAIKEAQNLYFQQEAELTELEKLWLQQRRRIEVVKSVANRTGWTLIQAKAFVDERDSGEGAIEVNKVEA